LRNNQRERQTQLSKWLSVLTTLAQRLRLGLQKSGDIPAPSVKLLLFAAAAVAITASGPAMARNWRQRTSWGQTRWKYGAWSAPKGVVSVGWLAPKGTVIVEWKSAMGHLLRPLTSLAQAPNSFDPRFQMRLSITAWNGMGPRGKIELPLGQKIAKTKVVSQLVLSLHLYPSYIRPHTE
jgi:hypothetical protein